MKRIIFIVLAVFTILSCTVLAADTNSDSSARTTPADWAKKDVDKAFKLSILDSKKTYYYGSFITREEFCEIVYNLIEETNTQNSLKKDENEHTINDTDNIKIKFLVERKIINGKENAESKIKFCPDDFLTREETAEIFDRLIHKIGCDIVYTDSLIEYDDDKDVSRWAIGGIQFVSKTGLMSGFNNVFYPKSNLSTEEAIAVVMSAYDLIEATKPIKEKATFVDKINFQMPDDENYIFSPLSIKMALAMAANGAEGKTRDEILEAIGNKNLDRFNENSKSMIEKYSQFDKLTLNVSNSVWVNTDNCPYNFKDSFKETVTAFYDAKTGLVNNDNAVDTINSWANNKTNGKIPTIIEDNDFWAALVNAIYFKGYWEKDFNEYLTEPDTFISADGTKSEIDFMHQTDYFNYAKTDDAEIIEMRYKTSFHTEDKDGNIQRESIDKTKVSMYFIMTERNDVENIIKKADLEWKRVDLSLPKFEIEYSKDITDFLKLNTATDKNLADFSGMMNLSPDDSLWIDKVLHKTFISVDEKGTEAAAVTAVMMAGATSARPEEPIEVKFDKPFYFVIRDETNGEILFVGRYAYAE